MCCRISELRSTARIYSRGQDALEQILSDGTIGERRHRLARLGQIGISGRVEHWACIASCIHPLRKAFGWDGLNPEAHVGKTVAAELSRQPRGRSRMIGLHVKARHHS